MYVYIYIYEREEYNGEEFCFLIFWNKIYSFNLSHTTSIHKITQHNAFKLISVQATAKKKKKKKRKANFER